MKLRKPDGIEFGKVYRDRITGFTGTCTGWATYISGCDQVSIVPPVKADGTYSDGMWFDDERLIEVETEKPVERTSRKGGPQSSPPAV